MIQQLLFRIKTPLLLAVVNSLAWTLLAPDLSDLLVALFNGIRFLLIFWAGFLALEESACRLWNSAAAGALVLAVDHMLVTGAVSLLKLGVAGFLGALTSFLIVVWLAMLLGALGGLLRRMSLSKGSRNRT